MDSGEIDGGLLGNFVARYERLRGEIKALNEDCGEVLKEAESADWLRGHAEGERERVAALPIAQRGGHHQANGPDQEAGA